MLNTFSIGVDVSNLLLQKHRNLILDFIAKVIATSLLGQNFGRFPVAPGIPLAQEFQRRISSQQVSSSVRYSETRIQSAVREALSSASEPAES